MNRGSRIRLGKVLCERGKRGEKVGTAEEAGRRGRERDRGVEGIRMGEDELASVFVLATGQDLVPLQRKSHRRYCPVVLGHLSNGLDAEKAKNAYN